MRQHPSIFRSGAPQLYIHPSIEPTGPPPTEPVEMNCMVQCHKEFRVRSRRLSVRIPNGRSTVTEAVEGDRRVEEVEVRDMDYGEDMAPL